MLVQQFKDLFPERIDTIDSNQKYILNNWKERQLYQNNSYTIVYTNTENDNTCSVMFNEFIDTLK